MFFWSRKASVLILIRIDVNERLSEQVVSNKKNLKLTFSLSKGRVLFSFPHSLNLNQWISQILYKNQYRAVPVTGENSFIVNIGKLVDDLIDNKVPAVRHRVAEVDFDRYSITYFLGPQWVFKITWFGQFSIVSFELMV